MTNTQIDPLQSHSVHADPIDAAIALLADMSVADHIVCDGSCNGVTSCTVAHVGALAVAA
jgi:hypothetical protein